MSLGAACCAQVSPVREFGIRLGMMWSCAALPVLAGPQITGVIIEHENGGFTGAMVLRCHYRGRFGRFVCGRFCKEDKEEVEQAGAVKR